MPEALHRLTESYLAIGLNDEAAKTAAVLGYNYPGSAWYQGSYDLIVNGTLPSDKEEKRGVFGLNLCIF